MTLTTTTLVLPTLCFELSESIQYQRGKDKEIGKSLHSENWDKDASPRRAKRHQMKLPDMRANTRMQRELVMLLDEREKVNNDFDKMA